MTKSPGIALLREKKVILHATSKWPRLEFQFLRKNHIHYADGKTEHLYIRERRGVRVKWFLLFDGNSPMYEPRLITGDGSGFDEQLELAHGLMKDEGNSVVRSKVDKARKR